MKITVLRILRGSCSDGDTCPTLALTDHETYVVVGTVVTDPEARASLGIGPDEQAVEVPGPLLGR